MAPEPESGNVGYNWLSATYGVSPVQPFPVSSTIGTTRHTWQWENGQAQETYPSAMRPKPTFAGHLGFALKYEGVCLEFLARLFAVFPAVELADWVNREPSGQYARRAGFFYEWLTGKRLDFPGVTVGNYVDALPETAYLTAARPVNVARWRVRNNLPGIREYCPLVRRTPLIKHLETYDCAAELQKIENEYGADVVQRSAVWLTIKESRASFQIEREADQKDRIKRFAAAMEAHCNAADDPFSPAFLALLQTAILGENASRTGLRRSPVFVGETVSGREVVHYVAPHWTQIPALLEGLMAFERATPGRSPLLRAAVLSFGFVYVHPMADGNGRISRFLVNDTLRRDNAVPAPLVLPVSATITRSVAHRAAYDQALDIFSRPFMKRYRVNCFFATGPLTRADDGIETNFEFSAYDDARFAWAFPDLTRQTEYLGQVIQETIEMEMRQEARSLLEIYQVREQIKSHIEAPDMEIDRIIRSVRENNGKLSGKIQSAFPFLEDAALATAIIDIITQGFSTME